MPTLIRPPSRALAPWVQRLWATVSAVGHANAHYVERVLPTGAMHVVLRLADSPLALFEAGSADSPRVVGHSVVGGARSSCYVKRAGDSTASVGVQLQPGAALGLLGVPAGRLAESHTSLDALWGNEAQLLREGLFAIHERALFAAHGAVSQGAVLGAQLDHFEAFLLARVRRVEACMDEDLSHAVSALEAGAKLSDIVEASGISHRAFITRFHAAVGLTPKVFARVRRFQRVIDVLGPVRSDVTPRPSDGAEPIRDAGSVSLARLALDAGYADQAHLSREFRQFAEVSPSAYLKLAPGSGNHIPVRS